MPAPTDTTPRPPDRPVEGVPGAPPRFLPDEPFPPYRFVPGHAPHPFAHREGYAFGQRDIAPPYLPCERWHENHAFLRGLDFFNRGWWWEAHEAWEGCWHVARDRDEAQRDLLKGLIQLAACALNRERGFNRGADGLLDTARLALGRARARVRGARGEPANPCVGAPVVLMGLDLDALENEAVARLARPCLRVDGFWLRPRPS